jgi:hypothetical protein
MEHTNPALKQGLEQGIQHVGNVAAQGISLAGMIAAMGIGAGGAAGLGVAPMWGGAAAGAAPIAAGGVAAATNIAAAAVQEGSAVAAKVAPGVANVLSSAEVGTLTPGTTAGAYGTPLFPSRQPHETPGPKMVNNYGDIHTGSYEQFYQGQQRREAQQAAPFLSKT